MTNPIARGTALAILAAALFGLTTPLVKYFGAGVGAFSTAALLYAGAMVGAGLPRRRDDEPSVQRSHLPRLLLVALFGAALAPASLAWGLQHAGALSGSLLLNLEPVFTLMLAWLLFRETIGARVGVAVVLMIIGGASLTLRATQGGESSLWGIAAIVGATIGWALDNTLTRPLADLDPRAVVFWKACFGACLSTMTALFFHDVWPSITGVLALLACGATGYGLSLRAYLHAQRLLGAGRTGSLFAAAPFVGGIVAVIMGERENFSVMMGASVLFGIAVYLHATERHAHTHRHSALDHEHAHEHNDGHHEHVHDPPVHGVHSHAHHHEATSHEHPHGGDVHHQHDHNT